MVLAAITGGAAPAGAAQTGMEWPIHSTSRPQPPVVNAGRFTAPAPPPSDAVVLFGGRSLDAWRSREDSSKPARWRVQDDYMEVVPAPARSRRVKPSATCSST